jgi:hypothetical protein
MDGMLAEAGMMTMMIVAVIRKQCVDKSDDEKMRFFAPGLVSDSGLTASYKRVGKGCYVSETQKHSYNCWV